MKPIIKRGIGLFAVIMLMALSADIARKRADGKIMATWQKHPDLVYEVHERPRQINSVYFWMWYLFGDRMDSAQYWVKLTLFGGHESASSSWWIHDDHVESATVEKVEEEKVTVRFEPGGHVIVFDLAPSDPSDES